MIIGIDASRANREIKTGVEWYSYYLIEELKKLTEQTEHQFFLYTDKPLIGELANLPKNWQERILRWPPKYFWTKIRLSLEMLRKKPDVLFIPAHVMPIFFPQKTVITIHDLGYERYPEAYSYFARNYLRKNYRFAVTHAKKIIVPTEFTKKELINLYNAQSEKIEVIYLGYNDKIFKPIKDEKIINQVLEKYKIKKPYLLFVGRLEIKKGLKLLIEAYKLITDQLPNLTLVLVGKAGFGYDKIIKSQILKLSIRELGYLGDENERAVLYAGAEAFIFSSLYEGFGIPILESMACGCPVVASDIEPIREIIFGKDPNQKKEDSAILVPVNEPEILAEKIKEILANQNLREKMISAGLKRVKNFSWQKCAKETLKIILNL